MSTVITFQSPRGEKINLTPAQVKTLEKAGCWPKDSVGEQYCTVSHGKHYGTPDCATNDIVDLLAVG